MTDHPADLLGSDGSESEDSDATGEDTSDPIYPSLDPDTTSPGILFPTEGTRMYQEPLDRLSRALDVKHPMITSQTTGVVHHMVSAKIAANTLLPLLPVCLEVLKEAWSKPASIPSTSKDLGSMYRIQLADVKFLLSHPPPPATSVIVYSATKLKQPRHMAPPDCEGCQVDTLVCTISTTQARITNYMAYFAAYALHLANQVTPLLGDLPDQVQQKKASESVPELCAVSSQHINTICHSVFCTSKALATSIALR